MREFVLRDRVFWLLLIFASVYILFNIGTGSLTTWDEAVYANIAREVLNTGKWLVLYQQGVPWFDKPPLYMWSTAVFYKIFGVTEFATRLTSGLFGIATIMLIYIYAKNVTSKNIAIVSALLLLALPQYIHFAKIGSLDVMLTFFIVLMISLFWMGQERPRLLMLCGIAFIFAYLAKGFGAFLGPMVIFFYCIFSGNGRLLFKAQFFWSMVFGLTAIGVWHVVQYLMAGPQSLDGLIFHLKRTVKIIDEHTGGINFYQKVVFNKNKPWAVLLYASIPYLLWMAVKKRDRTAILLCSWIFSCFVLFTFIKTKLHWYIIPIYPALAFSTGLFLDKFLKNRIFNLFLGLIILGMLVQVPFSWAFKLNHSPDIKRVAGYARELYQAGNKIYMIGGDDSELFYYDFALQMDKDTYKSLRKQGVKSIYCIILPAMLEEKIKEYNFDYEPIYESKRTLLYKINFKDKM